MPLIKMIKSGLVQQNYGYGVYPSEYSSGESIFIRPSIPLAPSDLEFLPKKPQPNTVTKTARLRTSDILFPRYNFGDLFMPKPSYPTYNSEGIEVGLDGKPLPPKVQLGSALGTGTPVGAPGSTQPEAVLLTEMADRPENFTAPTSSIGASLSGRMGVLGGAIGSVVVSLLTASASPERNWNAVQAGLHATMPVDVAQLVTQGIRTVYDQRVMLERMFQDAVTNPAARMTGTAATSAIYQALFSEGGVLGPGYIQILTEAVGGVPQVTWESMGRMALEGAQTAAETAAGGAVTMTLPRLLVTYLGVVASAGLGIVAPRQARQIAQRWVRDPQASLRAVSRISYAGMGG